MAAQPTNTRFDPAHQGTPPRALRRKPQAAHGFHRLPFVAGRRAGSAAPCWQVPASGGYCGGYETGEAMAQAFLKFLREEQSGSPARYLTGIAESFMTRFEQEGGKAMADRTPISEWSHSFDSLRGQYTGFFNTVSLWLAAAAKQLGANLDGIEEQAMLRRANAGLGFDEAAYMASLSDKGEG